MLVANGPEKLSENRAPHAGAFLGLCLVLIKVDFQFNKYGTDKGFI